MRRAMPNTLKASGMSCLREAVRRLLCNPDIAAEDNFYLQLRRAGLSDSEAKWRLTRLLLARAATHARETPSPCMVTGTPAAANQNPGSGPHGAEKGRRERGKRQRT